ncbi:MAG: asparagine synthase (glutamine-hydrolyzing) [Proteobacteria bacterium]|nr:asparagine synthase (glutamine-hydrolyzing) [Pseudomonadota bacterium]
MCGISGFFSQPPIDEAAQIPKLEKMRAALAHRGPDGSGITTFRHAALVHNRLAIIDLDGGAQPLSGASGDTSIVFNGEIYNYRELRASLKHYPFRTHSDTEVLLALYETEGTAGWRRLRGMYAFALWDNALQKGFLVRDPMGIKPLFYAQVGDRLLFASEAKGILAYTNEVSLDPEALHQLLNFRYVTGNASLFRGVRQLPPAGMIAWDRDQVDFSGITPAPAPLERELGITFRTAVERHLVSDVPVGCFLSGGIDSALVAKLAADRIRISSYTLEVGDDPGEADNAQETARWLAISNQRAPFALDDPIAMHRELVWHLETPKVNALQGAMLAAFTARHVKVALSGLGGDELFFGYNAHRLLWLAQIAGRLLPFGANRLLALAAGKRKAGSAPWTETERTVRMLETLPDWARVYGLLRNVWDAPTLRRTIYGERMRDQRLPDSFQWLTGAFPRGKDAVAAMAEFELKNKLVNDLLWQEDRVSMRVGLETRVPFLDWDLAQWALHRPRSDLMPWGRRKFRLRQFAATQLPPAILQRPKSGFQMDIVAAAHGILKPVFAEYLSDERLRRHRLFNPAFVHSIRRLPPSKGLRWHYFLLYLMAQSHIFLEEFDAG